MKQGLSGNFDAGGYLALPFLNKKKDAGIAGTIMQKRAPDAPDASEPEVESYSLEDCSQDIIDAIHALDAKALAKALQEAFEKMESQPHEEANKPSPHSYDAQNQEAAE